MSTTKVISVRAGKKQLVPVVILLLSIYSHGLTNAPQNYEFANGQWFDGQKLSGNPLENFANVQKIELRVKQGEILQF